MIYQLIFQWSNEPLFERCGPRQLIGLDDKIHKVKNRYNQFHELLFIFIIWDIKFTSLTKGTTA